MDIKDLTNVSILAIKALVQNQERLNIDLYDTSMSIKSNKTNEVSEKISLGVYANLVLDKLQEFKNLSDTHVLMPIKPTETMVMAVAKEHEGEAFSPYSLYDAYVKQAMIESQEQSHEH